MPDKIKVDLSKINTPQTKIINLIDSKINVLILGINNTDIAEYLHNHKDCTITAINFGAEKSNNIENLKVYNKIFEFDLNDINTTNETLKGYSKHFDCILCANILEYIYNPLAIINNLKSFLSCNGYFVGSVKNSNHGNSKLKALNNHLPSNSNFDAFGESPVVLYNQKRLSEFFFKAELEVLNVNRTFHSFDEPDNIMKLQNYPSAIIEHIAKDNKSFIFEYIFKARVPVFKYISANDYSNKLSYSINDAMKISPKEQLGLERCKKRNSIWYSKSSQNIVKIEERLTKLENLIKSDFNFLFKYLSSGIEIHPGVDCERVIINDYKQVLNDPSSYPTYYQEHIKRYIFAKSFIKKGDKILDLACGTGYGSRIIKDETEASSVTGVDISQNAVNFCINMYETQGLEFLCGDALSKSLFEKNTFDKIISFETLEHVCETSLNLMLANYYNWIKKGGMLICSTPNEEVTPLVINDKITNPYHCKHYYPNEIIKHLENAGFSHIQLTYQDHYQLGSKFKNEDKESKSQYLILVAQKNY